MLFNLVKPSTEQSQDDFDDEQSSITIQQDLNDDKQIPMRSNHCLKI